MTKRESMTGQELGLKLLASVKQMKAGVGTVVHSPVAQVRAASELSQTQFAALMGVSVRTLQEWEQGRRKPSGAAQTLLAVAMRHPEVLRELAVA
ncbi:helix-turn-helix domain-containing protein [Paralcaligenes ureilyticus]|uniref:Putative transcriptional regulator n=1 Tax=Paralcaligenes ureilyticus TaxID=627131 RepID=A0A4R3MCN9_9BURK|nr:type II toxin-antitoxin system MqsA family antitoxin [Paralcaligenes ureilyticus]TCT10902.1 putative transcriptional regulator [Paralcaligenes ureilyticus]